MQQAILAEKRGRFTWLVVDKGSKVKMNNALKRQANPDNFIVDTKAAGSKIGEKLISALAYAEAKTERRNELAPLFKETFGLNLMDYWDFLCGFDIVNFDKRIGTPDGISCNAYVFAKWGQPAVDLIKQLLSPIKE